MEVVFVRHGEADYSGVEVSGFSGFGRELAPLTPRGREQARQAAKNPLLTGVQRILSSPFTRALETAAILSRKTGVELTVELSFHEWLWDLTGSNHHRQAEAAYELFLQNKGLCPADSPLLYEESSSLFRRVAACLEGYRQFDRIALVSHGALIRHFVAGEMPPHCGMSAIQYDLGFPGSGFPANQ